MEERKDGVPFVPTPEEMAAIARGEVPPEKPEPKKVPLTEVERATLIGLIAARTAVMGQIEGYMSGVVAGRLGVHRNRILGADTDNGTVTLASDAPKE